MLGLVQGVTEVVPVSSSAHLTLVPWLLGWPPAPDRTALAAGLHAGSCAGIALALRAELRGLDRRTAVLLATATLPGAAAGALAADAVERRMGRPPQLAALLAGAGVLLWAADRRPARVDRVGPREAAVAGLAQVLALAPGVSRSGAVLTGLRAAGVEGAAASRFALLLSLPVTFGAAVLALARADRTVLRGLARPLAAGVPLAAVSAHTALRTVRRRGGTGTGGAALYRLALAAAVTARLRGRGRP